MYLYKTINLKNGQYYFGISNGTRGSFDPVIEADPEGKFFMGDNGQHPIPNAVKSLIMHGDDENELIEYASKISKDSENDPNFIGVFGTTKKIIKKHEKYVEPIDAQSPTVESVPESKERPKMKPTVIKENEKMN